MKVITTNLLNRFWKNGVAPIKSELSGKLDKSKIVASTTIAEEGMVMDGKIASQEFAKLNGDLGPVKSDVANIKTAQIMNYTETDTGETWNSRKIYKRIVIVPLGIVGDNYANHDANVGSYYWIDLSHSLVQKEKGGGNSYPLTDTRWGISCFVSSSQVCVNTKSDWSGFLAWVTIFYTRP